MIRPYKRGDEVSIAALEKECFSEPWSAEAVNESAAEGVMFFVFEENGNIVGYVGLQTVLDEGYITNVAVSRDYRRRGIGKALIEALDQKADDIPLSFISLEVRESNTAAIFLYTSCGYENAGVRKGFYRNPRENAIIMTKRRQTP